jgi:hypothetical protein
MALFRKKMFSAALAGMGRSAESTSFCISCGQRNGIQNRGGGTIPASVLQLAELVEVPKERPFQTPLVAGKLGEGVPFSGVGVDRASEEDLVPVPFISSAPKRLARFRMRRFVRDVGRQLKSVSEGLLVKSGPQLRAGPL